MNKFKIILAASIAATLTFSCSSGDEGDGNSSGSGVYSLIDKESDRFTYEVDEEESCTAGGTLEIDTYEHTVYYSIENNIMVWQDIWADDDDTLKFKGSSNELIGTWTRTKNKDASCKLYTDDYFDESWLVCKEGYDITKAVFTETTVAITQDICITDYMQNGQAWDGGEEGWKMRPINCNTYEVYKGTKIVTVKENKNDVVVSSNNKSCKMSEPSKSKKQAVCKEAWDEYQDVDYYWEKLYAGFYDCLKQDMPEGFWIDEDYGDYCDIYPEECEGKDGAAKIAAKPAAKAKVAKSKFKSLLKKKK